jgi:hypothetical protein
VDSSEAKVASFGTRHEGAGGFFIWPYEIIASGIAPEMLREKCRSII